MSEFFEDLFESQFWEMVRQLAKRRIVEQRPFFKDWKVETRFYSSENELREAEIYAEDFQQFQAGFWGYFDTQNSQIVFVVDSTIMTDFEDVMRVLGYDHLNKEEAASKTWKHVVEQMVDVVDDSMSGRDYPGESLPSE